MSKPKVYLCRAMTGMKASTVVQQAHKDKEFLENAGFIVLCPVTEEGVKASKHTIQADSRLVPGYWKRDKAMIREADLVFVMSPDKASLGCIREYGYARYHLQKKVITIFPEGNLPYAGAIAYFEDDFVTDSLIIAAGEGLRTHGTYWGRLKWKLGVLNRSILKSILHQTLEWFPKRNV